MLEIKEASKLTPMFQQYMQVKSQYPNALLLFRMGDFFELFFDDAKIASDVLGIALTHRNKLEAQPIPMAGVPHHSHRSYVHRLTDEGHTVVICDQVEEAQPGKLVRREVTRIVTPGMVLDPDDIESIANTYLTAVFFAKQHTGISLLDLSTGEFRVTELAVDDVIGELQRISPREILLSQEQAETPWAIELQQNFPHVSVKIREAGEFAYIEAHQYICRQLGMERLEGLGLGDMKAGIRVAGAILAYVHETQKTQMPHISRLLPYTLQKCMIVDQVTCANLELLETMYTRSRKGSLLGHLDHTVTPMGARKLKNWLLYPLLDIATIEQRLDLVELFVKYGAIREHLREILQPIRDLERLNSKISSGLITPYDLGLLCTSLEAIPLLIEILDQIDPDDSSRLTYLRQQMYPLPEVVNDIRSCLKDELPNTLKDGEFIREGYHPQLDEYRDIAAHGKDRILEMEYRERERTGIQSLHIKFNKVFGYFIEVTKANLHRVPTDFLRKQTMVNCERYITEELKEFEEKILEAQDKILSLEQQLFDALRQRIALHSSKITEVADAIAQLDVLTNFSHHAVIRNYCRPQLTDNRDLRVVGGRHPVVEATMSSGEFVPNDLCISSDNVHFILITGPNMSGKSTVMRQIALIALLAQIGAFVPAQEATIGICDRIFTRVGATDNLAGGQSTFMVEMTETSNILHNATSRSLVILDEIGRGTSTFDGISIAWSVAEYLHDRIDCRTLFATHYHELTELGSMLTRLRNMNVAINEWQGEIRFLHKLIDGSSNRSYGIQVARLAGLPRVVVRRAHRILLQLEQGKLPSASEMGGLSGGQQKQLSLFIPVSSQTTSSPIEEELRKLDLDALSPIEALRILHRWQHDWCKDDADAKSNLE